MQFLYLHLRTIVKQGEMLSMLLPFSSLSSRARSRKGKSLSGQSLLFASPGGHRSIRDCDDPIVERFRRSGQRGRPAKRQQYQNSHRNDWILSLTTSYENSTSVVYNSYLITSYDCTGLDVNSPSCAIANKYFTAPIPQHTYLPHRTLFNTITNSNNSHPDPNVHTRRRSRSRRICTLVFH